MKTNGIDWASVHYEPSVESKDVKRRGVTVRFMVSPLDIPELWRYGIKKYPDGQAELVVEFRYLTSSESRRTLTKDDVKIEVGKNSKRIYAIVLPLPADDQADSEMKLTIELAIDEIEAWESEGALRPAHADVIQDVLRQQRSQGMCEVSV